MTPDRTRLACSHGIHKLPLHRTGTDGTSNAAAALVLIVDPEHATGDGWRLTEQRVHCRTTRLIGQPERTNNGDGHQVGFGDRSQIDVGIRPAIVTASCRWIMCLSLDRAAISAFALMFCRTWWPHAG